MKPTISKPYKSNDRTFEKVFGLFDKKDYFNIKGLAKVQIGNFERALKKNDKGAQQILDMFKGDEQKAKDYITQVITDRKKEQAFNDYKALKSAIDSIQTGKPNVGAVDYVKRIIHNSSQKYSIAIYSALRNKKFTKWKDVHNDIDDLIGESINEDTKKRFDVDFYKGNGDRQTSHEEIIRGDKFSDIISQASKIAKSKGMNHVEFYYKDAFIGSIDKRNKYSFKKGRHFSKSPLSINERVRFSVVAKYGGYEMVEKSNQSAFIISKSGKTVGQLKRTSKYLKDDIKRFIKMVKDGKIKNVKSYKTIESVNEIDTKKANLLRTNMPGYVGPKFAKKASDEDILAMADLKDQHARIYNRYVKVVDDAIAKLQKKYRIKESQDGVPQGYNPMVESKTKESKIIQKIYQYSKNEKKFYDELAKHEVRIGQRDYAKFIINALRGFGINPREYNRIPEAEEKLYQIVSQK